MSRVSRDAIVVRKGWKAPRLSTLRSVWKHVLPEERLMPPPGTRWCYGTEIGDVCPIDDPDPYGMMLFLPLAAAWTRYDTDHQS